MVNTEFYSNAKIYKIVDNTNGNIYIGSTCKKLCQRIAQHRSSYKRYLDGKVNYVSSFKILKNDDYDIILVEEVVDCKNKEQLRARERHYIESLDCVNKRIEGRTKKEYRKEYYKDNKEKLDELNKQYRKDNKENLYQICICNICNCNYGKQNKARHEKSQKHLNNLNNQNQI